MVQCVANEGLPLVNQAMDVANDQGLSTLYLEEIVYGSSSRITHIDVNMEELQRRHRLMKSMILNHSFQALSDLELALSWM
ncbi:unnamed protein product, partial [Vitis vinifera]|uniref:Uncharacterized protein n=1 Tax=Vitis vinifera TaxID=29760 RepID=D7UDI4_VITVI